MGTTTDTAGHSRAMASTSAGLSDCSVPMPCFTPPTLAAQGKTISLYAPMLAIVFSTWAFEPWPISVMAITAATPMITPRAVRTDRSLFLPRLPRDVRNVGSHVPDAEDRDRGVELGFSLFRNRFVTKDRRINTFRIVAFRSAKAPFFRGAKGDTYFRAGPKAG